MVISLIPCIQSWQILEIFGKILDQEQTVNIIIIMKKITEEFWQESWPDPPKFSNYCRRIRKIIAEQQSISQILEY